MKVAAIPLVFVALAACSRSSSSGNSAANTTPAHQLAVLDGSSNERPYNEFLDTLRPRCREDRGETASSISDAQQMLSEEGITESNLALGKALVKATVGAAKVGTVSCTGVVEAVVFTIEQRAG